MNPRASLPDIDSAFTMDQQMMVLQNYQYSAFSYATVNKHLRGEDTKFHDEVDKIIKELMQLYDVIKKAYELKDKDKFDQAKSQYLNAYNKAKESLGFERELQEDDIRKIHQFTNPVKRTDNETKNEKEKNYHLYVLSTIATLQGRNWVANLISMYNSLDNADKPNFLLEAIRLIKENKTLPMTAEALKQLDKLEQALPLLREVAVVDSAFQSLQTILYRENGLKQAYSDSPGQIPFESSREIQDKMCQQFQQRLQAEREKDPKYSLKESDKGMLIALLKKMNQVEKRRSPDENKLLSYVGDKWGSQIERDSKSRLDIAYRGVTTPLQRTLSTSKVFGALVKSVSTMLRRPKSMANIQKSAAQIEAACNPAVVAAPPTVEKLKTKPEKENLGKKAKVKAPTTPRHNLRS